LPQQAVRQSAALQIKGLSMLCARSLTVVLALAGAVQPLTASAQDKSCMGARCRALGQFLSCDKPVDGAKVFSARVLAMSKECSNNILSVQVEDGSANRLPSVIEINLGPCISFYGNVGDVTQIALREPHRPEVRRYGLACRVW
jgi:hypothetical protein